MKGLVLLSLLAFSSVFASELKSPRSLSLFSVVKFPNRECQAKSDASLTGTCFSEEECSDKNGVKDGNCASGFGACCVFRTSTCGGSVMYNNSYVENPGYPSKFDTTLGASPCAVKVTRMDNAKICAIRLDFTDFELAQPVAATGTCTADTFVIAPGATSSHPANSPPTLCGTNTGHHLYIDAGSATTAATLTATITTTGSFTSNWRIKVSQIECSSPYRPPNGCLQYFMGTANTVTSFNFDGTAACATGCNLQQQNYNVCFKPESGMCGMQYVESTLATGDAFQLNDNAATNSVVTAANCANTGLQIPVQIAEYGVTSGIYCGANLASVAGSTTPNVIKGRTGAFNFRQYSAVTSNSLAGFSIDATQVPC